MMQLLEQLLLLVVSLLANGLSAMAGRGAGLLQLPALIFLGLPFSVALATHKVASVALGLGAGFKHWREGNTESKFSLFILAAGLPGVVLGANVVLMLPERASLLGLGLLTTGLGLYSIAKKSLGQQKQQRNRSLPGLVFGVLGLFLIGVLNGSLTSGTGMFVTLWLVVWFGLDFKQATAYTLILVGIFWNGTGAVTLALQTPVYWQWLPALLLGSLLGGYWGAMLANRYGNYWIKRLFETMTIGSGLALLIRSF